MKLAKPNRFAKADAARQEVAPSAPPHESGMVGYIDVDGAVLREGNRPVAIELFGARHSLDAEGLVRLGGKTYRLAQIDGRDVLIADF